MVERVTLEKRLRDAARIRRLDRSQDETVNLLQEAASAFEHNATNDQIAAVMLQHGNEEQRREALVYAGIAAPEGQQEPVAWQRRVKFPKAPGAKPQWEQCSASEATDQFERKPGYEYRPLYTRSVGQAVGVAAKYGVMTRAVFDKNRVPVGTKLYTHAAQEATDAELRTACYTVSVAWPLSGEHVMRLYKEVREQLHRGD